MQNKKLYIVLAVFIGIVFFALKKMKIEKKPVAVIKTETKVAAAVKPEAKAEIIKDKSGAQCVVHQDPMINESSQYLEVLSPFKVDRIFTTQKVKFKEDGVVLEFKDSYCDGFAAEISFSPFDPDEKTNWPLEVLYLLRRPVYTERGEFRLRYMRTMPKFPKKTSEQKTAEWKCGPGTCRLTKGEDTVKIEYVYLNAFKNSEEAGKADSKDGKELPLAP